MDRWRRLQYPLRFFKKRGDNDISKISKIKGKRTRTSEICKLSKTNGIRNISIWNVINKISKTNYISKICKINTIRN